LLRVGQRNLYIDLAAERGDGEAVALELIALEVQSIGDPSPVADLQQALGQFIMYRMVLAERQPERTLFLAVPGDVYDGFLSEPLGRRMMERFRLKVMVFDPATGRVLRWIS
jgi:XisH protein